MALYRQVHTTFWDDVDIQEWQIDEKLFYLYLFTNKHVRQCGIYEISIRQISFEMNMDIETVERLLSILSDRNKIRYCKETKEIALKNWFRYNPQGSPTVKKNVLEGNKQVKTKQFIDYLSGLDTLCLPYPYPNDRVFSSDLGNKENKESKINKKREETAPAFSLTVSDFPVLINHFEEIMQTPQYKGAEKDPERMATKFSGHIGSKPEGASRFGNISQFLSAATIFAMNER